MLVSFPATVKSDGVTPCAWPALISFTKYVCVRRERAVPVLDVLRGADRDREWQMLSVWRRN